MKIQKSQKSKFEGQQLRNNSVLCHLVRAPNVPDNEAKSLELAVEASVLDLLLGCHPLVWLFHLLVAPGNRTLIGIGLTGLLLRSRVVVRTGRWLVVFGSTVGEDAMLGLEVCLESRVYG